LLTLLALASCTSTPQQRSASPKPALKATYNAAHDQEIKGIFDLARNGRWELAESQADALCQKVPQDESVKRLRDWVAKQRQLQREQAMENKIREIDADNSAFNPTIPGLLTEQKDRGLPPKKDIRDAIERIEKTPYIPESFGKTVRQRGQLFGLDNTNSRMARVLEKEVSIHLDNVPLEAIILNIGQTAGVNFVADKALPALKQTLSVNLDKVKLGEFLRHVSRNYELQFQVGEDLIWVVDAKDPKKVLEETRFYRLRKGFVLPAQFGPEDVLRQTVTVPTATTVTESQKFRKFVNDEAPAMPSIERAITNLFTGKYMIDYERNLVVARGTQEQLELLERIIEEFDQPIQQVLIEARFITVSQPAFMQLGVLWETGRNQGATLIPQDFTGLVGNQNFPSALNPQGSISSGVGVGLQEIFTNVLGRETLSATISALEQSGESQTLSAPRLTVLNNRPATISDGKVQYYYEEYQVKQTVQQYYTMSAWVPSGKPTKITSGAELNVLASISGDGKHIMLALNPRVNTDVQLVTYATLTEAGVGGTNQSAFEIKLPQYRTQELATRVVVKSGETVVMGGVLERQQSTYVESVPLLGNLPLLGTLFRRRTEVDKPRYLLIFVTATILSETGEFVVYQDEAAGISK